MREHRVRGLLEDQLQRRGVRYTAGDDLTYHLTLADGTKCEMWIGNLVRDMSHTEDPSRLADFLDAALEPSLELPGQWGVAAPHVRWSAEPADLFLGDALVTPISPGLARALVYVDDEESQVRYLTPADLERWDVTEFTASAAASGNLDALLDTLPLQVERTRDVDIGWFDTSSPSKASFIFASALRTKVSATLGWPIMAVAPARDFLYLFRTDAPSEFLGGLGNVVVREFTNSGYPVTNELLEIDDHGVRARGAYADPRGS